MASIPDSTIKIVLIGVVAFAVFYMVLSFGGIETFSGVDFQGNTKVRGNEEQTYSFRLTTVDPEQFRTPVHYREQYGKWHLEDANGTILSPGKEEKIYKGVYQKTITIQIPPGHSKVVLIAEINEYQFGAITPDGEFIRDKGQLRVIKKLDIEIPPCIQHSECNFEETCLGQFGYCNAGLCEAKGECYACAIDSDCSKSENAVGGVKYACTDKVCVKATDETVVDQAKVAFEQPITEPNPVEVGQPPEPKPAPPLLSIGVLIMISLVAFLIMRKKGTI